MLWNQLLQWCAAIVSDPEQNQLAECYNATMPQRHIAEFSAANEMGRSAQKKHKKCASANITGSAGAAQLYQRFLSASVVRSTRRSGI